MSYFEGNVKHPYTDAMLINLIWFSMSIIIITYVWKSHPRGRSITVTNLCNLFEPSFYILNNIASIRGSGVYLTPRVYIL